MKSELINLAGVMMVFGGIGAAHHWITHFLWALPCLIFAATGLSMVRYAAVEKYKNACREAAMANAQKDRP